jgi:hypothetical protein
MSKTTIIENSIDCNLMDTKNISKLVDEYTIPTPLQEAFNRFCIEKSIPNHNYEQSDSLIINSIINSNSSDLFEYYPAIEFIKQYCSIELKTMLSPILLKSITSDRLPTKLLLSIEKLIDGIEMDNELSMYDSDYVRDDCSNNELDAQATCIAAIVICNDMCYEPLFNSGLGKELEVWRTIEQVTDEFSMWSIDYLEPSYGSDNEN